MSPNLILSLATRTSHLVSLVFFSYDGAWLVSVANFPSLLSLKPVGSQLAAVRYLEERFFREGRYEGKGRPHEF